MDKKDTDKKCPMPSAKKNFEPFDIWGKAQFAMWSNIRYDFELITELTRYRKSAKRCLELLDTVNHHLKNHPDTVFFDGTIKCLKYLVKNDYLVLSDLPSLTQDEKYLVELLEKYSKRLDITEVLSDIEEPTLRVMLLEYPHLIGEVLKDNPLGGHLVGQALLKNGITGVDDLLKKVDNGLNSIEVDPEKNSKEAMKCKIIYLGLRINSRKIKVSGNAVGIIHEFETLTDEVVENETYTKGIFNALYAGLYGSDDWNKEKKTHLSGCDALYLDFQLLMLPQNHMSMIYDIFLSKYVDEIGKKYFGDTYRPDGFIASLSIKMIVVILIYRAESFLPKDEKEEVDIFSGGAFLRGLNYAVRKTGDPKNPLELKQWFIDYFCDELDKRVAFLKMQINNNVGIVSMMGRQRVIYLPVFESFMFFCQRDGLLEQIIYLLKNKDIPNSVKDEIFINFALNIQKIITRHTADVPRDEQRIKDTFILLINKTFEGLVIKTSMSLKSQAQKYYQNEDLIGDGVLGVLELILGFDLSKNDSFIAYLKYNLELKIRTSSRRLVKNDDASTFPESSFEEGFFESIPDASDFITSLEDEDQSNLEKIREYTDKLPEKEREAVKKMSESNEKLNDTERKAKNRGLNKIREMMGVS